MKTETITSITFEELEKLLDHKWINSIPIARFKCPLAHMPPREEPKSCDFNRLKPIMINGVNYCIEWYCNISYLITESGAQLPFEKAEIDSCWPNGSKGDLRLYRYHGDRDTSAIIPLEF